MDRVVVLRKTCEKHFSESEILIGELDLKILCIFVPYKRRMKRKDREKLAKLISAHEKVFTLEPDLYPFEVGVVNKSWLGYFLPESINYLMKSTADERIAIECSEISEMLKLVVLELGEKYRVIELYTTCTDKAAEFADSIYGSVGLPVKVKEIQKGGQCEANYIVKIANDISLYDAKQNIEYTELNVELLYPLSKYADLPLEKILKSGLECRKYRDIIQKGMVKIVGEISK